MQLTEEQRTELTARKDHLEQMRQAILDAANRQLSQLDGALSEVVHLLNDKPEVDKPPSDPPK